MNILLLIVVVYIISSYILVFLFLRKESNIIMGLKELFIFFAPISIIFILKDKFKNRQ